MPLAIICSVGDGKQFKRGRGMAAWLGLTTKQHSSGGKDRLLGASKRVVRYLRKMLIHGARSAKKAIDNKTAPGNQWLQNMCGRQH